MQNFSLSEDELLKLANFTRTMCGIHFTKSKFDILDRRVIKRMEILKINTFSEYFNLLKTGSVPEELFEFINAITIQETYFFRQPTHFAFLKDHIIPELIE